MEVTVTGQRGWIDEKSGDIAADMTVIGKVWLSPSSLSFQWVQRAWSRFEQLSIPFPSNKENAIEILTSKVDSPDQPIFSIRNEESKRFESPKFAKHPKSWDVAHIDVQVGEILTTNDWRADLFNNILIRGFNFVTGNMLKSGNILTWNLWFSPPDLVDTEEWKEHAKKWREAIEAEHGPQSTKPKYFNGTPFRPGRRPSFTEFDMRSGQPMIFEQDLSLTLELQQKFASDIEQEIEELVESLL